MNEAFKRSAGRFVVEGESLNETGQITTNGQWPAQSKDTPLLWRGLNELRDLQYAIGETIRAIETDQAKREREHMHFYLGRLK